MKKSQCKNLNPVSWKTNSILGDLDRDICLCPDEQSEVNHE